MQFDYTANKTFARIHHDFCKYLFVRGSVGSGKSVGSIWHIFLNAMSQNVQSDGVRRSRYGIFRATYPSLKSTTIQTWKQWFNPIMKITYGSPIEARFSFPHPDGQTHVEIELVFIALERENEINKLQSLELTGAHMNEAHEMPQEIHQMLKSRIGRYPAIKDGGANNPFILCDYNSIPTDHWLYTLAEETEGLKNHSFYVQPPAMLICDEHDPEQIAQDLDGIFYKVNSNADNLQFLPVDYYIDQITGAESEWVSVFVMNNYGSTRKGRPVYKAYKDRIHCPGTKVIAHNGIPIVIGIDVGLTPAAAFTQLTSMGTMLVLAEIVTENTSIHEFIDDFLWPMIREKFQGFPFHIVMDPAALNRSANDKKSAYDIFIEKGLPCDTARTNDPLARREAVNFFLRKVDGIILSPQCMVLRKGFISEYKFEKMNSVIGSAKFRDKPEKNMYSHVHDGLQYAALYHNEGRVFGNVSKIEPANGYNVGPNNVAGY